MLRGCEGWVSGTAGPGNGLSVAGGCGASLVAGDCRFVSRFSAGLSAGAGTCAGCAGGGTGITVASGADSVGTGGASLRAGGAGGRSPINAGSTRNAGMPSCAAASCDKPTARLPDTQQMTTGKKPRRNDIARSVLFLLVRARLRDCTGCVTYQMRNGENDRLRILSSTVPSTGA